MTIRNLDAFFAPNSIAIIGPSRHSSRFTERLLEGLPRSLQKISSIHLVGISAPKGSGYETCSDHRQLPENIGLVVYLGSELQAPAVFESLARRGTRAILIPSPGFETWPEHVLQACREAARPASLRLIGPGSLGYCVPATGLNTLLSAVPADPGDIAFISRSGAVLNATLSWAKQNKTGFSAVVSLGTRMDVDIGDLIDHFAQDYRTRSILLHVEGISAPRKFLSAARAAARSKPVIIIRSGRSRDVTSSGRTHAGKLATPDLVYDAVFRRTGVMRVADLDEMFEAVETLSRVRIPQCKALAVVSNGRSLASLAADAIVDRGGALAQLSEETSRAIAPFCRNGGDTPSSAQTAAALVLTEDIPNQALCDVLKTVLKDPAVDGVLALQAGTAFTSLSSFGDAIAEAAKADKRRTGRKKAIVVGLVGGSPQDRTALDEARIPSYTSPAEAVRSIMYLARDAQSRDFLMAAPPSLPVDFSPDAKTARAIVDKAMASGQKWLSPEEVCAILAAYQIPIIETRLATSPEEAAELSRGIFQRSRHCVVKLISPDLPFKSKFDGVRLGVESPAAVQEAAQELISKTQAAFPAATIAGVSVHPMLEDRHGVELYMGLADTPIFGPVMVFGHGGTAVEDSLDISLELPPLDLNLAEALIDRTRIVRLLNGGETRPRLDREAVAQTLVKLSQITIDIPEILELDINPIVVRKEGILALDARMTLGTPTQHPGRTGASRLAIAPYPSEWEQTLTLKDGQTVFTRPVRPEDEDLFKAFFEQVSAEDLRLRFFAPVRDFNRKFLARLTQLDYARAMAFAAIDPKSGELLGVVRLHADPDHKTGEYAVMVRSDLKGVGLGLALMKLIIHYAKADGIETIRGEVLKENTNMLSMCEALGFDVHTSPGDPGIAEVILPVGQAAREA
ncbi:GNAT family N-acetyltransferase [Roseibium sediminis]|uniref:bifunctional acetate--CoA ligase family protein/GNAT family N-acetyltransferase n=1 Tax=Roseibium sediminis TaxID=1775174 RepID=UPI00123C8603|nr:GNAT family N-acetyltransferase [Roseibium sediminis]